MFGSSRYTFSLKRMPAGNWAAIFFSATAVTATTSARTPIRTGASLAFIGGTSLNHESEADFRKKDDRPPGKLHRDARTGGSTMRFDRMRHQRSGATLTRRPPGSGR